MSCLLGSLRRVVWSFNNQSTWLNDELLDVSLPGELPSF